MDEAHRQIDQIDEAAKLAFANNDYFLQIFDTILAVSLAQPITSNKLQSKCLTFFHRSFYEKQIPLQQRQENCHKLLPLLNRFIINDENFIHINRLNYSLIQKSIEIFSSVYDLLFQHLISNPDVQLWNQITILKDFLIKNWNTSYPLLPTNPKSDINRSLGCKISIVQTFKKIIVTQLPPPPNIDPENDSDISIAKVPKNHPFLYNSSLNNQSHLLIDSLLNLLGGDSLLSTSFFAAIITNLMSIFRKRPNFISNKIMNFILAYESQFKSSSKFEKNNLKIQLIKRFNDRIDKILMSLLLNKGFIEKDPPLKSRFSNKLSFITEMQNKQKKRGILSIEEESDSEETPNKRRKIDPTFYYDESKVVKQENFRSLYKLTTDEDIEDISNISADNLNKLIIESISKVDANRLNYGLEIIISRYLDLYKRFEFRENKLKESEKAKCDEIAKKELEQKLKAASSSTSSATATNAAAVTAAAAISKPSNFIDDDYDPSAEKSEGKKHVIDEDDENFDDSDFDLDFDMKNEKYELPEPKSLDPKAKVKQVELLVDNLIKRSNDGKKWVRYLSRLATRGTNINDEIANYIRDQLFRVFKNNIKSHIDDLVEWLNEEYYTQFIVHRDSIDHVETSSYLKYTTLVLDYLIPFLEISDRTIFIRLLSELPYLDYSLISKLKSICLDPLRSKLGFQPILYLIMFRPPVFDTCIKVVEELYKDAINKNNEQLKNESENILKKYKPDSITNST